MSAIKTCSFCGRLFTGALSNLCFGCELNESSPKKSSNTHAAHQKNIQPVKYPPSKLPQNNQQAVAKITKCNQCDFSGTKKQLSIHNVSHIKVKFKFKSSPKKPINTIITEKNKLNKNQPPKIVQLPGNKSIVQGLSKSTSPHQIPLYTTEQKTLYTKVSQTPTGKIKTMDWSNLSGWGMNGGLPSLGKKSR